MKSQYGSIKAELQKDTKKLLPNGPEWRSYVSRVVFDVY